MVDSTETALKYASSMTWKGKHPVVTSLTKVYSTGVRLSQKAMKLLEKQIQRCAELGKWFVTIQPGRIAIE